MILEEIESFLLLLTFLSKEGDEMSTTLRIPFLNIKLVLTFRVTAKVFFLLLGEHYIFELLDDALWEYGWLKWGGCLTL